MPPTMAGARAGAASASLAEGSLKNPMAPRRRASEAQDPSSRSDRPAGAEFRAPLIGTKLGAAAKVAGYRERPRLSALLDHALDDGTRLTLTSAPPGYGKTMAVVGWLESRRLARAWLLSLAFAVVAFVGLALLGHDFVAFEVTVLMINWSVLIASGVLLSVVFRRARQSTRLPHGNQTDSRQAEAVR